MLSRDFSNWKIYVTVKAKWRSPDGAADFSNWKIYVTVKDIADIRHQSMNFSNWKIYVTVKVMLMQILMQMILVTEKFTWL